MSQYSELNTQQLFVLLKQHFDEQNEEDEALDRKQLLDDLKEGEEESSKSQEENCVQKKQQIQQCEWCEQNVSKYACPACGLRSCSLACVKEHKNETGCDGCNNQFAKQLSKYDFDASEVRKDLHFLQSTLTGTESLRKKLNFVTNTPDLLRLKLLKVYARKKLQITLDYAPQIIMRHRKNLSFYYMRTKELFFSFEVRVYQPYTEQQNQPRRSISIIVEPASENDIVAEILQRSEIHKHTTHLLVGEHALNFEDLESKLYQKKQNSQTELETLQQTEEKNKKDKIRVIVPNCYKQNEIKQKSALNYISTLYSEGQLAKNTHVQVDAGEKLGEVLRFQKFCEFPTMILVHEQFLQDFTTRYRVGNL